MLQDLLLLQVVTKPPRPNQTSSCIFLRVRRKSKAIVSALTKKVSADTIVTSRLLVTADAPADAGQRRIPLVEELVAPTGSRNAAQVYVGGGRIALTCFPTLDTTPSLGAVAYTQPVHMRLVLQWQRLMRARG